ncbi:MAG TPA: hypothetical protein VFS01_08345 [Rhizomicrobium sp.]|jgi:hypothetical protein|nr:hypothetical protein [Rhizomicrobium sp.]
MNTQISTAIRYLAVLLAVIFVVLAAIGVLNYLVDPLWFFGGNKIQPRNFAFNERVARMAHFMSTDRDFDCYIFGASRVAMVNVHDFKGHRCFMVSFENASPRELVAYASYMKAHARREPTLVVVGVDDFDFIDQADANDVPEFVRDGGVPHFWQYYFSWDVATWSLKTIFDISPKARYFGKDLSGQIRADARMLPVLRMTLKPGQKWHMSLASVSEYAKFRQLFPKAHLVGYATPVAATRIAEYRMSGLLPFYIRALIETSTKFDEMYDFSIPSTITADPGLTYDGSHYQPSVSREIAIAIQRHEPSFGVALTGRSTEDLEADYASRLARFHKYAEAKM